MRMVAGSCLPGRRVVRASRPAAGDLVRIWETVLLALEEGGPCVLVWWVARS